MEMDDPLHQDLESEEPDSPGVKLEIEDCTYEAEQIVHDICPYTPQVHVTVINTENDNVDPKLVAMPIVYTMRLDHMDALHSSFIGRSNENIINDIWEESKPELDYKTKSKKKKKIETSFRWVQLRISQLKRKCKALTAESSELISHDSQDEKNLASTKLSNKAFELLTPTSLDNQDDEKVVDAELSDTTCVKNLKLLRKCKPLCVIVEKVDSKVSTLSKQDIEKCYLPNQENLAYIIKDKSLNDTDIVCFDDKVLVNYRRVKGIKQKKLIPYIETYQKSGRSIKIINVCCWYYRQNFISLLYNQGFPENVKQLLTKTHNCQYGKCVCCCGEFKQQQSKENIVADLTYNENLQEDMEIQNLEQELSETFVQMKQNISVNKYGYNYNWLEDLLTKNDSNTLINAALNYNTPIKKVNMKKIVPTMKQTGSSFKRFYSNNVIECFKLNPYGNIQMYGKNLNSTIIQKILDDVNIRSTEYKICCWRKRDIIIKNNFSLLPGLAKYLSIPHPCVAEKCTCCCSFDTRVKNWSLGNITLPKRTTPTHPINITKINSASDEMDQIKVNTIPVAPCHIPIGTTKPCQNSSSVQTTEAIPNITSPKLSFHTSPQVVSQAPKIPIATSHNPQIPNVDSMITSILQKFKNVRLTIDDDGKIGATLDTPVNSLSTAELKVLANILTHAQKQVQAIGLTTRAKEANTSQTHSPNIPATSVSSDIHNKSQTAKSTVSYVPIKPKPPIQNVQTVYTKSSHQNTKQTSKQAVYSEIPMGSRDQIYSNFATILNSKRVTSLLSFSNYVNSANKEKQMEQRVDEPVTQTPIIASVFSLKDFDSNSTNADAKEALKSWSDEVEVSKCTVTHKMAKPAPIQNNSARKSSSLLKEPLKTPNILKRKSEDRSLISSKIRVIDPSKLGLTKNFDEPVASLNIYNSQISRPPTQYPANQVYLQGNVDTLISNRIVAGTGASPLCNILPSITSNTNTQNVILLCNNKEMVSAGNNVQMTTKIPPVKLRFLTNSSDSRAINLVPVTLQFGKNFEAASNTHGSAPSNL